MPGFQESISGYTSRFFILWASRQSSSSPACKQLRISIPVFHCEAWTRFSMPPTRPVRANYFGTCRKKSSPSNMSSTLGQPSLSHLSGSLDSHSGDGPWFPADDRGTALTVRGSISSHFKATAPGNDVSGIPKRVSTAWKDMSREPRPPARLRSAQEAPRPEFYRSAEQHRIDPEDVHESSGSRAPIVADR
jgi:hypothetical protein